MLFENDIVILVSLVISKSLLNLNFLSIININHFRLQFLNLQIDLIEDFRRRLVQLHNSQDDIMRVKTTQILNTVNYVTSVLREWGESVVDILISSIFLIFYLMASIF